MIDFRTNQGISNEIAGELLLPGCTETRDVVVVDGHGRGRC